MPRAVALLRAINVGGHTVRNSELAAIFESLGLEDVATVIASGNVLFTARSKPVPALEKRIGDALQATLGYEVVTFVRTAAEMAALAVFQPFGPDEPRDGASLFTVFLPSPPEAGNVEKLLACRSEVDDFAVVGREVWWLARKGFSGSTFQASRLERLLRLPGTARNVTTVRKLAAKLAAG